MKCLFKWGLYRSQIFYYRRYSMAKQFWLIWQKPAVKYSLMTISKECRLSGINITNGICCCGGLSHALCMRACRTIGCSCCCTRGTGIYILLFREQSGAEPGNDGRMLRELCLLSVCESVIILWRICNRFLGYLRQRVRIYTLQDVLRISFQVHYHWRHRQDILYYQSGKKTKKKWQKEIFMISKGF